MTYRSYHESRAMIEEYIVWSMRRKGYAPSAQEIADYLELSRPHIHALLDRMEAEGLIERDRTPFGQQAPRGIRVIRATTTAPTEET